MTEDDILAIDDIMFTAVNYRDWENVLRYIGHDTLIQIGPLGELRGKTGADAVIAYFDKHYDYRFLSWQHNPTCIFDVLLPKKLHCTCEHQVLLHHMVVHGWNL